MVKTDLAAPAFLVVAFITLFALLSFMNIIDLVAAITVAGDIHMIEIRW